MRFRLFLVALSLAVGGLPLALATPASAANVITVTNPADAVTAGTLRDAFNQANADGQDSQIVLATGTTYHLTLCADDPNQEDLNADGDLDHTDTHALTITGNGATIDNDCVFERVIDNLGAGHLTLSGLGVTGGRSKQAGGGVRSAGATSIFGASFIDNDGNMDANGNEEGAAVHSVGSLDVHDSTVRDNHTPAAGGGLWVPSGSGSLLLERSLVTDNSGGNGAAVTSNGSGGTTIRNSTITGNYSGVTASGVRVLGGPLVLEHATIVDNDNDGNSIYGENVFHDGVLTAFASVVAGGASTGPDCGVGGTTTSHSGNIDTDGSCGFSAGTGDQPNTADLRLGPLHDNGGPTLTRLPLAGSPLVDAVPTANCSPTATADQRGVGRPFGAGCDAGAVEQVHEPHGFTDIPAGAWYEAGLRYVAHEDIVSGFPDGTYRPKDAVNRGQIANMLWTMLDAPTGSPAHTFTDIPAGAFYEEALRWAKANDLVMGFPDGTYKPKDAVNRGQIVNMLWHMVGAPTGSPAHTFTDIPAGAFYEDGLDWAAAQGIVTGFGDGTYRPKDAVNRGQIANMLWQLALNPAAWGAITPPSTVPFA